ncbi:MAG: argininosuccinate lyase [Gemmatimonadetes bacterium]|nr:argininosuccinate lyase [Gemmatimonadota bacterium]
MIPPRKDPAAAARGAELASDFTVSLHYDRRMYREDVAGSIAHARMLAQQGIITPADAEKIVGGLRRIEQEIECGSFNWRPDLEDIHMNVEARLFEIVGDVAGKLHTARSRNDQVATDTRLYAKGAAGRAMAAVHDAQAALLDMADAHLATVLPGYTHLQRGQPVLLAHHMLAHFEALERDAGRFQAARRCADVLPLGSGALAGVPYPVDREFVAEELGFSSISRNSMDAVADRDFVLDFVSASAVCMTHLSRLAEELVIWSTEEFAFVRLGESYTSGSSIMPQKRNPDFAELVRARTGRTHGLLTAALATMKGLPLTYNMDLQEVKELLFDAEDILLPSLTAAAGLLRTAEFNTDRMRRAAEESDVLATDVADYLVAKGLPFREAHIIVSQLARRAARSGKRLRDLSLDDYRAASPLFDAGVLDISVDSAIAARDVAGGTAPRRVEAALAEAKARLAAARRDSPSPGPRT